MAAEAMKEFRVESDEESVWVYSAMGVCVACFATLGITIHHSRSCTCVHERPSDTDWEDFKSHVLREYAITIDEQHKPRFLYGC